MPLHLRERRRHIREVQRAVVAHRRGLRQRARHGLHNRPARCLRARAGSPPPPNPAPHDAARHHGDHTGCIASCRTVIEGLGHRVYGERD